MKITGNGFDYTYFLRDTWNRWARLVVDRNENLRPGERARLKAALGFPDTFENGISEYLLYKALRSSDSAMARGKAEELAFTSRRFARMEQFLAAREARDEMHNVIPLVRQVSRPRPAFDPLIASGFGVFFGMQPPPVAAIFRPAAAMP
ncbi:MAG: hypothetical protein JXA24_03040 [Proteobacteria bacterium]|nr:hypothetical protein [Pseudomonadota bacterium]